MPSRKPGKFSTSVVFISAPPAVTEPSKTSGCRGRPRGVDGRGVAGGAGADDDDVADVGLVRSSTAHFWWIGLERRRVIPRGVSDTFVCATDRRPARQSRPRRVPPQGAGTGWSTRRRCSPQHRGRPLEPARRRAIDHQGGARRRTRPTTPRPLPQLRRAAAARPELRTGSWCGLRSGPTRRCGPRCPRSRAGSRSKPEVAGCHLGCLGGELLGALGSRRSGVLAGLGSCCCGHRRRLRLVAARASAAGALLDAVVAAGGHRWQCRYADTDRRRPPRPRRAAAHPATAAPGRVEVRPRSWP